MSHPPILDYHEVEPLRRCNVRFGTLLGLSAAFALAMMAILNVRGWMPGSAIFSGVLTLVTALVFVVTTILRRSCARPPVHYRGMLIALAAGAGCAVIPSMLRWTLLGYVETMPWTVIAWLLATIGASFTVYASYAGESQ